MLLFGAILGVLHQTIQAGVDQIDSTDATPFEVIRKNRPPKPSGELSNNQYPSDFLTLSVPTEEKSMIPQDADTEVNGNTKDQVKNPKGSVLFALFTSLGIFGVFTWRDYRYRQTLQVILSKNQRLLSGDADDNVEYLSAPQGIPVIPIQNGYTSWYSGEDHSAASESQIALLNDHPKY